MLATEAIRSATLLLIANSDVPVDCPWIARETATTYTEVACSATGFARKVPHGSGVGGVAGVSVGATVGAPLVRLSVRSSG